MDGHDEHRYALLDGASVDMESLSAEQAHLVKKASRSSLLMCPICAQPLIAKMGTQVKWHCAHRNDNPYRWHESESPRHKMGKARLGEWALTQWPEANVTEEYRLPDIKQIADVMVHRDGFAPLVLEMQYSDLSGRDWTTRHHGYASLGIEALWVLGSSRARLKSSSALIDQLASAMLAQGHELLYLNPQPRRLTLLTPPPASRFRAVRGERIGRVPVRVTKAHLTQLRLDGMTPWIQSSDY